MYSSYDDAPIWVNLLINNRGVPFLAIPQNRKQKFLSEMDRWTIIDLMHRFGYKRHRDGTVVIIVPAGELIIKNQYVNLPTIKIKIEAEDKLYLQTELQIRF